MSEPLVVVTSDDSSPSAVVVTQSPPPVVVVSPVTETRVIVTGIQGPPGPPGERGPVGPPGAGGDATILTRPTAAAIGGHRVVIQEADGTVSYADHTDPAHADMALGLTIEAADAGAEIQILVGGETIEPSWTWDVTRPIYLGATGLLTQTPPTTGFLQQVAIPLAADRIYWQPQPAVILE